MADGFVVAEPVMRSILDYFSLRRFILSFGPVSELRDFPVLCSRPARGFQKRTLSANCILRGSVAVLV